MGFIKMDQPKTSTEIHVELKKFVTANTELETLENLLRQFNIFESIGAVRHEERHSDFLSFLLNPKENHNIKDKFLKLFLKGILNLDSSTGPPLDVIELDAMDLNEATVERETNNIDIQIISEQNKFVVTIENKIDSAEHDNQLVRYRIDTNRRYGPEWKKIFLYLSPKGSMPSDTDHYLGIDYSFISNLLDVLFSQGVCDRTPDLKVLVKHYSQMIRRHIMEDSEITRLCKIIYQKHKKAVDEIVRHIPGRRAIITSYLEPIIKASGFEIQKSTDSYTYFYPPSWKKWGVSPTLTFQLASEAEELKVHLAIQSGSEDIRKAVFQLAQNHSLFKAKKHLSQRWHQIYKRFILKNKDYEQPDDVLFSIIQSNWSKFMGHDFKTIDESIRKAFSGTVR